MDNEIMNAQKAVSTELAEIGNSNLPSEVVQPSVAMPTIWNDEQMRETAWKAATFLSKTDLVPSSYKAKPENCMIAVDIANRTGMTPLTVMQNLYIVQGKPSWSGQMCIALINTCRRFTPLEFEFVGERGTDDFGCYAHAIRLDNGKQYISDIITIGMAKKEGWFNKSGSKWQTMPVQMMMYRAGAFFGRVHCPDVLMGIPLADEQRDVYGYDEADTASSNVLMSELDEEIKCEVE